MTGTKLQETKKPLQTRMIPLDELYEYTKHPFFVKDDEDMDRLIESIQRNGLIYPIIVRENPLNGKRYEIVSGHRRVHAFQRQGIHEISAIIKKLTDEEADEMVVDTNCHREKILPSEKSRAYHLKMDAIKRQGKRTDLTSSHGETKCDSATEVGKNFQDSRNTVYRYIRLVYLIPELLDMVDEGAIALSPAVSISYLPEKEQRILLEAIKLNDCTPSYSQCCNMQKESKKGKLSQETIFKMMAEEKANQKPYLRFKVEDVKIYFPRDFSDEKIKAVIWNFIRHYQK